MSRTTLHQALTTPTARRLWLTPRLGTAFRSLIVCSLEGSGAVAISRSLAPAAAQLSLTNLPTSHFCHSSFLLDIHHPTAAGSLFTHTHSLSVSFAPPSLPAYTPFTDLPPPPSSGGVLSPDISLTFVLASADPLLLQRTSRVTASPKCTPSDACRSTPFRRSPPCLAACQTSSAQLTPSHRTAARPSRPSLAVFLSPCSLLSSDQRRTTTCAVPK